MLEFNIKSKKSWGHEEWIVNGDQYCGKILYFNKGGFCSLHYHKLKTETFYILDGEAVIKYDRAENIERDLEKNGELWVRDNIKEVILTQGQHFHIEPGLAHQIIATKSTRIIEFSTQHFESDSYRFYR